MKIPRYGAAEIAEGLRNPRKCLLEIYKLYKIGIRNNRGLNIVEEDWDNLLLLDGCRYDFFTEENDIDGELAAVTSRGSATKGFLMENFDSREFPEIVYVSANPNLSFIDAKFHERVNLWEDHWDDDLNVVPPEAVTESATEIAQRYPHKRIIVHYMQPHFPFIGETGQKMYESGHIQHYRDGRKFWAQLDETDVKTEKFKEAYRENLRVVLGDAKQLLERIVGKTVVTSDHGNEFGRFGVYGHPGGTYLSSLVKVPWLVVEDERKEIVPGNATAGAGAVDNDVKRKLEALGYK
jgi:hypothetical protein